MNIPSNTSSPSSLDCSTIDSIDREFLESDEYNRVLEIIGLIKAFYECTSAQVFAYGKPTNSFEIRTGICQGCVLFSTIFNDRLDNGHCLLALKMCPD